MKWEKERIIDAPIDIIWALFEEENAQRIMPKVVENRWIDKKPGITGSTYEQTTKKENVKKRMWLRLWIMKIATCENISESNFSLLAHLK